VLNYSVLSKNFAHFRNFSGLEVSEFGALNLQIKYKYPAYEQKRLKRKDRKRKVGAGHNFTLSLTAHLLMLLIYYHRYPSSTLLGCLFYLSQSNVLKDMRRLEPLVSEVLPQPEKQYDKVRWLQSVDEIEALFPGFKAFWMQQNRRFRDRKQSVSERRIIATKRNGTP
jgi:hypothetical protein